jgi:tetratricopeptide (TPR) repeat protein
MRLGYDPAAVKCNLGLCFEYRNRPQQAIKCFDEAIELNPQLQPAYLERAIVRYNAGQRGEHLIDDVERALELGPRTRRAVQFAANLHADMASARYASAKRAADLVRELQANGISDAVLMRNSVLVRFVTHQNHPQGEPRPAWSEVPQGVAPPREPFSQTPRPQLAKYGK